MANEIVVTFLREMIFDEKTPRILREKALDVLLNQSVGKDISFNKKYIVGSSFDISTNISQADHDNINSLLGSQKKIGAIKELRRITNWSLLDSKRAVENYLNFSNAERSGNNYE